MPPKTRSKSSKASKENIGVSCKLKTKPTSKLAKNLPRKALADKTNSASDENASYLPSKPHLNVGNEENFLIKHRQRRERRIPSRYVEIDQQNLSDSNTHSVQNEPVSKLPLIKNVSVVLSPLKTPNILDNSLIVSRPKRICRLPSKFNDHSISPSKYVQVQPAYASTPKIVNRSDKQLEKKDSHKQLKTKKPITSKVISTISSKRRVANNKNNATSKTNSPNSSADTNNNAKTKLPQSKAKNKNTSPKSPVLSTIQSKRLVNKNFSVRILEDKKKSLKRDASNIDVYEFTYDPNDEPPPQKKKRKKPTKKREPKPKTVVFRDNYDKKLAKALTTLKNTISEKSSKPILEADKGKLLSEQICTAHPATDTLVTTVVSQPKPCNPSDYDKSNNIVQNYNSVRVEDIALNFEQDDCMDDVNYSPVHSFSEPSIPAMQNHNLDPPIPTGKQLKTPTLQRNQERPASTNDPLNLKDDLSFFDDQPVASSSLNVSTRNPAASPWRVEFGCLPIKWQVNTYVKPNMTPAFESSFMNFNDSKKKHVYTNMVADTNEENDLPQIYEDYSSKLKQTSIISFIKEVVEKNANKKKDKMTPIKNNTLFEDFNNTSVCKAHLGQNENVTPKKTAQDNVPSTDHFTPSSHVSDMSNENRDFPNNSEEKENSAENAKSSNKKKKDRNLTYFGFDDENDDQENVSPIKKLDKRKLRAMKPRSRAVLQEINEQKRPTRAVFPVSMKSKPTQNPGTANKLFDQMKSATEPPVFPAEDVIQTEITNIADQNNVDSNDSQPIPLFEDIEVVHHLKAHRKSYGKAKKTVTFGQNSMSDSDVSLNEVVDQSASSDEDDLHDLTFKVPSIASKKTTKKKRKKPKVSKKEEREVEAWAAGFNSMCEDIEEFDLVVE